MVTVFVLHVGLECLATNSVSRFHNLIIIYILVSNPSVWLGFLVNVYNIVRVYFISMAAVLSEDQLLCRALDLVEFFNSRISRVFHLRQTIFVCLTCAEDSVLFCQQARRQLHRLVYMTVNVSNGDGPPFPGAAIPSVRCYRLFHNI